MDDLHNYLILAVEVTIGDNCTPRSLSRNADEHFVSLASIIIRYLVFISNFQGIPHR